MYFDKILRVGAVSILVAFTLTGCGGNGVKLAEYKGIEATKVICEIGDDEVEAAIEDTMYEYITYDEVTDRPAKKGDTANITYITVIDGEEDEYYSGEEEEIVLGEGYEFPDLENAIIGMKIDEKKTVSVELTDDYVDEEDVGKKASVEVTLNSLSIENTPEYTDDFVKENLGYESKAEYEEQLKKDLLAEKEEEFKSETIAEILQKIVDNSTFNGYSKELYKQCEEDYNANNEYAAAMYQMELAEYEEMIGIDEETKKADVEAMVHEQQVIDAIAKKENLSVSDKDIKNFAEENYEDYDCESVDEFLEEYGKDDIRDYLIYQKVSDFLYDNATFTEITEEEYYAREQEQYESEEMEEDGEELDLDSMFEGSDAIIIDDSDDDAEVSEDGAVEDAPEESEDDDSAEDAGTSEE